MSGALPAGLSLHPDLGIIEGTPTAAGPQSLALVRLVSSRLATQSGQPQAHPVYITLSVQEDDIDGDGTGNA